MISFARSSAKRLDLVTDGIDVIIAGERRVDLRAALEQLADRYGIRTVRTDSGGALNAALLEQGLVDEISLLVSPWLVGEAQTPLVGAIPAPVAIELASMKELRGGYVWLRYALNR